MPKIAKELTAIEIARLSKQGKHATGGIPGLMLQVRGGSRSWIYRYMINGKRREMGLGSYPSVTLAQARERCRHLKYKVFQSIDPLQERIAQLEILNARKDNSITFKKAMEGYLRDKEIEWKNFKHRQQWENSLLTYATPILGNLNVSEIGNTQILNVLRPIWNSKTETASRLRGRIENILDWSRVHGYCNEENPARWKGNLDKVLPAPNKTRQVKHHAALPFIEIEEFMFDLRHRSGTSARALEFCILTATRSGEVRGANWNEIDIKNERWIIPAQRMKANKEHHIPLSPQAISILKGFLPGEPNGLIFQNSKGRMLSDMSFSAVLKRMQKSITTHGFRSTFRDWAGETQNYPHEVLEHALAHQLKSKTEAAYARGTLYQKRRSLMNAWGQKCWAKCAFSNSI